MKNNQQSQKSNPAAKGDNNSRNGNRQAMPKESHRAGQKDSTRYNDEDYKQSRGNGRTQDTGGSRTQRYSNIDEDDDV